jgi:hypothetical protein
MRDCQAPPARTFRVAPVSGARRSVVRARFAGVAGPVGQLAGRQAEARLREPLPSPASAAAHPRVVVPPLAYLAAGPVLDLDLVTH